jgi:putative hydrolase of the HAD superfamily
MSNAAIRAVLFDFGGVITESPFDAFRRFESQRGLPEGFLQTVNRRNADDNAWARFERAELSPQQFDEAFALESTALGHGVRGLDVIDLLYGPIRSSMVDAVARCREHFLTACLTNNVRHVPGRGSDTHAKRSRDWLNALSMFDHVIESSKVGARKPEPRFFELACQTLHIEPQAAVFLDDLGANLKPARAMGMRTIKVSNPDDALAELESVLELRLR